jgi:hypothetical protein
MFIMFGLLTDLIVSANSLPCCSDMKYKFKEHGIKHPFNCNWKYTSFESVVLCTYTHTLLIKV